ncbi:SLAP domain-containing protein [Solibacillus sp. FSL H8-0538]|uniref:SLAP domain-containing protein n=1 Tax=Solibacillus sp. FSL H8-0538 TaxID=2921400 RepID=UPI0030FC37CD
MQQLQFEASWNKALATQDRHTIEKIFTETKQPNSSCILCSPIRQAINHKQELLVTVLVHNFTDQPLTFNKTRIVYRMQDEVIADEKFTLPTLIIPPQVSLPWTFIFPSLSYSPLASFENGRLEIL